MSQTPTNEPISVIQLAEELGKQRKHLFKVLERLGIPKEMHKSNQANGQKIAFVTAEDASRVRDYFSTAVADKPESAEVQNSEGVFYLIQLEPEHDPGRIKLGFAANINERLRSHKTSAPFATVLQTWPCKLLWEKTVIECVSQDCERLHTEVFRANSIDSVLSKCNQLFALMPEV